MALDISNIEPFPNGLAIAWNDSKDSFVEYKTLRKKCPCANCSGESDVFGNVYKNQNTNIADSNKYKIVGYMHIGHYAIRIAWGDGHDAGIYSFDFMKSLDAKK